MSSFCFWIVNEFGTCDNLFWHPRLAKLWYMDDSRRFLPVYYIYNFITSLLPLEHAHIREIPIFIGSQRNVLYIIVVRPAWRKDGPTMLKTVLMKAFAWNRKRKLQEVASRKFQSRRGWWFIHRKKNRFHTFFFFNTFAVYISTYFPFQKSKNLK